MAKPLNLISIRVRGGGVGKSIRVQGLWLTPPPSQITFILHNFFLSVAACAPFLQQESILFVFCGKEPFSRHTKGK